MAKTKQLKHFLSIALVLLLSLSLVGCSGKGGVSHGITSYGVFSPGVIENCSDGNSSKAGKYKQISKDEAEKYCNADYIIKGFLMCAQERGYSKNAIIGIMSYALQEGTGFGSFTYESYYCMGGPGNVSDHDTTLDNDAWIKWMDGKGGGFNTGNSNAFGVGMFQMTNNYGDGTRNASNFINKATEEGYYWQDPQWGINESLNIIESKSGDSDWVDPKTYSGSAEEYCKRVTAFVGMPGWTWTASNDYMSAHTKHVSEAEDYYNNGVPSDYELVTFGTPKTGTSSGGECEEQKDCNQEPQTFVQTQEPQASISIDAAGTVAYAGCGTMSAVSFVQGFVDSTITPATYISKLKASGFSSQAWCSEGNKESGHLAFIKSQWGDKVQGNMLADHTEQGVREALDKGHCVILSGDGCTLKNTQGHGYNSMTNHLVLLYPKDGKIYCCDSAGEANASWVANGEIKEFSGGVHSNTVEIWADGACKGEDDKDLTDAVKRAKETLGKPYVWGAVGPDGYDCSGLLSYCLTGEHSRIGTTNTFWGWPQVKREEMKPGDVVVYDSSGSGHCGLYIGDGKVIHAAYSGMQEVTLEEFENGSLWTPKPWRYVRYPG